MRKLILFDIDGTLVRGGPAKEAFHLAMVRTFGTAGPIESHDFSGKTDPQIARELLVEAGLPAERIEDGFEGLWTEYLGELETRLSDLPMTLLPGVVETLAALEAEREIALGLVTGNIVRGADLKLGSVGLVGRFAVGGYGSDDEVRNHLPGIAIRRAAENWGVDFDGDAVVVVGDTPLDIACGRHCGTRTVGVATGSFGMRELESCGADHTFEDFSETGRVLEVLVR